MTENADKASAVHTPPDRLSLNPRSKFFDMQHLERGVGIRFKGNERQDVMEYCVSEGWIRIPAGKSLDRHGHPMTVKLKGPVEAWYLDAVSGGTPDDGATEDVETEQVEDDGTAGEPES